MSEIMTAFEEYCVPVFTDLPAAQLTLLGDQLASGFAAGHADMQFQPGSDVVVFGAGPVGLGAVQAGRVMGAGQVIAIDPIRYRREFALKMGATTALDPNAEGDGIVERVRELCRGPNDRRFAGGVSWGRAGNAVMSRGADFVVEAAGIQAFPPKVEAQPDPTNVKTVQQAWDCTRDGRPRDADGVHAAAGVVSRARRWRSWGGRFIPASRAACTSCATSRAT